jgi:tRNA uridine 5-carboxymethylaminomethyl modification enzyme
VHTEKNYDVIVVGAGHAGCEAALACARMGTKTALFTINLDHTAQMSCNPAIGGLAKGHLVREIDALGGQMAKTADATCIQFKVLNARKGPAVHGLRAQADKREYSFYMKTVLENTPNLDIKQSVVEKITCDDNKLTGVVTDTNTFYGAKAVILTTGTFLNGKIYIGFQTFDGGRLGDPPSRGLSASLKELGFKLGRMKTGTNPRIDKRSVDFSQFIEQPGDDIPVPFSFSTNSINIDQVMCWLVNTNEETNKVIMDNIERSPMFSKENRIIYGIGPRYCPSIEDKVVKFPEKKSHQIFLEPEGRYTNEIYLNGLSTSLPRDVQLDFLRTLPGFKNVEIMRPGYAIEYDFSHPTQLSKYLESKSIPNLFFAGQINGTSGYEEAAGQGLLAGINAALKLTGKEMFCPDRSEGYMGVMADDLTTKGVTEPYRLFSSRAEYRLILRNDNADIRLTEYGRSFGLIDDKTYDGFMFKKEFMAAERQRLSRIFIHPSEQTTAALAAIGTTSIATEYDLVHLLGRPEVTYDSLSAFTAMPDVPLHVKEYFSAEIQYAGYIKKQEALIEHFKKNESKEIPADFDYLCATGLPKEARQNLNEIRPLTLGQASRIQGVTASDINVLMILIKKHSKQPQKA